MLKRKLDYRPTWDLKLEEPISGNYYPVTSKITIENRDLNNAKLRLSALTDRAQGGSSLKNGEIELMVQFHFSHNQTSYNMYSSLLLTISKIDDSSC